MQTEGKFLPILLGKPESPEETQGKNFWLDTLSVYLIVEIGCMNRAICAEVKLWLCFVFSPHAGLRTDLSLRFWFVPETQSHLHYPDFCSRETEAGLLGGQWSPIHTHPSLPTPTPYPPPGRWTPQRPDLSLKYPDLEHYQLLHCIARDTADSHTEISAGGKWILKAVILGVVIQRFFKNALTSGGELGSGLLSM